MFLQCNDGCGVKRRYTTTVSVWPDKLNDQYIGQDVGMQWPWMSGHFFIYTPVLLCGFIPGEFHCPLPDFIFHFRHIII